MTERVFVLPIQISMRAILIQTTIYRRTLYQRRQSHKATEHFISLKNGIDVLDSRMCKRITSLENTVENSKHREQNRIKRENKMRHEETGTLE